jgi:hypothetical protein
MCTKTVKRTLPKSIPTQHQRSHLFEFNKLLQVTNESIVFQPQPSEFLHFKKILWQHSGKVV